MSKLSFEKFYQDHLDTLNAYRQASSTMYVDQNTIAPKKGARATNEVLAILAREAFARENDPATIAWIKEYETRLPDGSLERKEVHKRLESILDTENIPADEYAAYIQAKGESEVSWHEAKEANDYKHFQPALEDLMRKQLDIIKYSPRYQEGKAYDFMLDMYEPGMNQEKYDAFFEVIRKELPPLIEKVKAARQIDTSILSAPADVQLQSAFSEDVLDLLHRDPGKVYQNTTEHPFTDFLSHNDVRITTHYYPERLASAVLSTVHEYGHALYGLQIDEKFDKTTLGDPGMASHESQSRLLENHVGRTLGFWKAIYPKFTERFPQFQDVPVEDFVRMLNASVPGLIRTEADELTYPLHILIRYELEKEMAEGKMDYDQLPEKWADKYEEYLGIRPQTDAQGVLQDMHWSAANFGYFPTYALGSAYAAQLAQAMNKDIDVEQTLADNHFEVIEAWLRDHVHHYGASKTMEEIVEEVSGKPFDPHIYTDYLKDKYSRLYNLD